MREYIENRIDINLPQDFQKVTEATRESIYFLASLENLFKEHIVVPKDYDKEQYKERLERIKKAQDDFQSLENIFYYPKPELVLPSGTHKIEIDNSKFIKSVGEYIKLKERVDELQYEILKYLFEVENNLINAYTNDKEHLQTLKTQYHIKFLTYSAFEHSKDEDKFDNYRIYISDKKIVKDYSKENDYPIRVKIRNYDFNIRKYRNLYKMLKNSAIDLIFNAPKLEEEEQLKKISFQQFELNKKVKGLSIFAILLTIIGLIYGTISTYFLINDHIIEVNENQSIEKLLQKIDTQLEQRNDKYFKQDSTLEKMIMEIKENTN